MRMVTTDNVNVKFPDDAFTANPSFRTRLFCLKTIWRVRWANFLLHHPMPSYMPKRFRQKYIRAWSGKLAMLLKKRFRLPDSLALLAHDRTLFFMRRLSGEFSTQIREGMRLSEALRNYIPIRHWRRGIFEHALPDRVAVAEVSGELIAALERESADACNNDETVWRLSNELDGVLKANPQITGIDSTDRIFTLSFDADAPRSGFYDILDAITRMVHMIILGAIKSDADQIVFELLPPVSFQVEFRINHAYVKQPLIPGKHKWDTTSRIEAMANLEYWKIQKQSGRFRILWKDTRTDIAVTTEMAGDCKKVCLDITPIKS